MDLWPGALPDSALPQGEITSPTLSSLTESLSSIAHIKILPRAQPISTRLSLERLGGIYIIHPNNQGSR